MKSVLTSRGGHIRYHNVPACFVYVLKINKTKVFSSDSINLYKSVILNLFSSAYYFVSQKFNFS